MTVKELIEVLQTVDPNLDVGVSYDMGCGQQIERKQIIINTPDMGNYGPYGVIFCSENDGSMDYLINKYKYKAV